MEFTAQSGDSNTTSSMSTDNVPAAKSAEKVMADDYDLKEVYKSKFV